MAEQRPYTGYNEYGAQISRYPQLHLPGMGPTERPSDLYGIPWLDMEMQAEDPLPEPVLPWGSVRRSRLFEGTYHFYTDDYRFTALAKRPTGLLITEVRVAAEMNLTVVDQTSEAEAIWRTYQKRAASREWQDAGVRLLVDLNVGVRHRETNLLGVPDGWRAYSTRGYEETRDLTEAEFDLACKKAGTEDILFVVYGGGSAVQEKCLRRGWRWFPERMNSFEGRQEYLKSKKRGEKAEGGTFIQEALYGQD